MASEVLNCLSVVTAFHVTAQYFSPLTQLLKLEKDFIKPQQKVTRPSLRVTPPTT